MPKADATIPLPGPFRHLGGLQWQVEMLPEGCGPGDSPAAPAASTLRLLEDGVPLGPRHALHAEIAERGGGRYSHWQGELRFSSSDGSDPNRNGRRYSFYRGTPTPKVLGLGTCHLHPALAVAQQRGLVQNLWPNPGITSTAREALQALRHYAGIAPLPPSLMPVPIALPDGPRLQPPSGVDLLFLEFGANIDVAFGSVWLPRHALYALVERFGALGPELRRVAYRWYRHGLVGRNEAARSESVAPLLAALPRLDVPQALVAEIIQQARGEVQDVAGQLAVLAEIRGIIGARATCLVCAQNAFTPDGRPLSWPLHFPAVLQEISRRAGLPLLLPSDLVAQHGVAFALQPDLHHFTDPFLAVLGEALMTMGERALAALPQTVEAG